MKSGQHRWDVPSCQRKYKTSTLLQHADAAMCLQCVWGTLMTNFPYVFFQSDSECLEFFCWGKKDPQLLHADLCRKVLQNSDLVSSKNHISGSFPFRAKHANYSTIGANSITTAVFQTAADHFIVLHLPHLDISVLLLRVSEQSEQKVCTQLHWRVDKDKSKRDSGCNQHFHYQSICQLFWINPLVL